MRTLFEIEQELEQVREKVQTAHKLQVTVVDLQEQIAQCRAAVGEALEVMRREQADVEELERMSFASFVARLRGDREERLEQEQREAIAAKVRYDALARDLEGLESRLRAAQRESSILGNPSIRYRQLLKEKEQVLLGQGGVAAGRLGEIVRELEGLYLRRREMEEAVQAGDTAVRRLEDTLRSLSTARDAGVWDMMGGGMLATMAKHERLGQARSAADAARQALSRFRTELADVSGVQVPDVQIGEFASFADYFFDGFFVDMYVQDRIARSQEAIAGARIRVQRVVEQLCRELEGLNRRAAVLEQEREKLLEV